MAITRCSFSVELLQAGSHPQGQGRTRWVRLYRVSSLTKERSLCSQQLFIPAVILEMRKFSYSCPGETWLLTALLSVTKLFPAVHLDGEDIVEGERE